MEQASHNNLLVISDDNQNLSEIADLLRFRGLLHETASDPEVGIQLCRANPHSVVLLCFSELHAAQAYRYRLAEFSKDFHSIVLVSIAEAKLAAKLTDSGVFQDYFVFKPIYDPGRLGIAINNGHYVISMHRNLLQSATSIAKNLSAMRHTIVQGHLFKDRTQDLHKDLVKTVNEKIGEFQNSFASPTMKKVVTVTDPQQLEALFERLKRGDIQPTLDSFGSSLLSSLDGLFADLKTQAEPQQGASPTKSHKAPSRGSILVVEDNPIARELYQDILDTENYSAILASDAKEAVLQLSRHPVDLIITDVNMPGVNGVEFATRLREHEKYNSIPLIIVSAHVSGSIAARASSLGVIDLLAKPFSKDRLLGKIDAAMSSKLSG